MNSKRGKFFEEWLTKNSKTQQITGLRWKRERGYYLRVSRDYDYAGDIQFQDQRKKIKVNDIVTMMFRDSQLSESLDKRMRTCGYYLRVKDDDNNRLDDGDAPGSIPSYHTVPGTQEK